jgi:ATP-dependent Clp protease ATP-binding subunit ClpA
MGHNYVGAEHLLLGLLIEGEGIGAHVLVDLGATLEKVRAESDKCGDGLVAADDCARGDDNEYRRPRWPKEFQGAGRALSPRRQRGA